jgi:arabinose-5-phosphate isomerase
MAQAADVHLDISVEEEACPLKLAPTASTTATLAMGDALAVALLEKRGFTAEDFARSHPSGSLGKRLLLRVSDVMRSGDRVPTVSADVTLRDALLEMTDKGLGMTAIVDRENHILGIYTDGDLRRTLDTGADIRTTKIRDVMHTNCTTTHADVLAAEALHLLEENKITSLLVADDDNILVGALNIHDLFREGLM